jgi:hypothetical protein
VLRISGTLAVKRVTGAFYQMAYFFFLGLILGHTFNSTISSKPTLGHKIEIALSGRTQQSGESVEIEETINPPASPRVGRGHFAQIR